MTRRRAALLAGATLAAVLVAPSAAHAGGVSDGLWWYEATGIPAAHEIATGEGVTIAMIDSPVDFSAPNLVGADVQPGLEQCPDGSAFSVDQQSGAAEHATTLASVMVGNGEPVDGGPGIAGVAPDATLLVYWSQPGCDGDEYEATAYRDMLDRGVDLVVSAQSLTRALEELADDSTALRDLVASGTPYLMALANSASDFEATDPRAIGAYNGVVGVETAASDGGRDDNIVGPEVGVVAPGAGFLIHRWDPLEDSMTDPIVLPHSTSQATAYAAGALAVAMSAAPDATGPQILQSLVRTTGGDEHEPERTDEQGYGFINLEAMLAVDPTQYPDENPFVRADGTPSPDELAGGGGSEDPGPDADPGQQQPGDAAAGGLLVVGIVIGVVGIGIIVLALVLILRRRAARTTSPSEPPAPRS